KPGSLLPLQESERGVSERRRDGERLDEAVPFVERLDLRDGRTAVLLEPGERPMDVVYLEGECSDAVRVLREITKRSPPLAEGLGARDDDVARLKDERA